MKLTSLLNENLIFLNADVSNFNQVIELFAERFSKTTAGKFSAETVRNAIYDREKLGSTSFPEGIAIPHGRLDNFDDTVIGICTPKNPVLFDGRQIRFFSIEITSKAGSAVYIQSLATFIKIARDAGLFQKLLATHSAKDFLALLDDVRVKKEIEVCDIMTADVISVSPDQTLKDVINIFYAHNICYVPVVDGGKFVGEITINQIFKQCIPDYARMIGTLNFMSSFKPFEELLLNEDKLLVKEIMQKPEVILSPDSPVFEAVLELNKVHRRYLPVVKDNGVVGVVSYKDILYKVLRG